MNVMTAKDARIIAKRIIAFVGDGEWTMSMIDKSMPAEWELSEASEMEDFFPFTVDSVARAIMHHAEPTNAPR